MIEVEHLSKTYGSTAAIADVSFSVESGEILGFLGPNGAGKTTTMRILSGYLPASSGTARIAGLDVHENSMGVRQRIGYLPENPPLYPEMTVEGFLFFVARIKQVPAGDRARRVTSAIERCGLVEKRKVLIRKLSKGFRQRVGIAQAIVHDPPVIILDEPTVGLDPRQIIEVRNLIKSLGGEHTIILSTHILPEVSMTCNRVTIINRGKIVAAGSPENLMGELAAGEGYEVEVEGEADLLNSLLLPSVENLPGVRSVELIPKQQFVPNRYRLRALCESEMEPGREIAAAIIASGFGLCEMRRNRATLEDVFLRLTAAEKKPEEESLVHTEPEVDQNLQAATEISDSIPDSDRSQLEPTIADTDRSELEPIVENQALSDPQESSEQPQPEPMVEIVESSEQPQPEPMVEIVESSEQPQPEPMVEIVESSEQPQPEPMVEIVESSEQPQPEPMVEIVESSEQPQPEPMVEIVESSGNLEPEVQLVVDFLEIVERQESIEHPQPQSEPITETVESTELSPSEPPPVPDFLQIAKTEESLEHPQPQPIVENLQVTETVESTELSPSEPPPVPDFLQIAKTEESLEHPQPPSEPITETPESIEQVLPQSEPITETLESTEPPQPQPIVENLEVTETPESIEQVLPQSEPITETLESTEPPQPQPIVENLEVTETPESIEQVLPQSEPITETLESTEPPQPQPIVENLEVTETPESIEQVLPQSEPITETLESTEPPQPQPIVENLEVTETP
ncbi:ATP-binding cassette domain-containing protein, partial [Microcoleus sp. LEGE 07076]|nr:ATP-binding cassette domain-containing protein [Microcoleus sp. LEGE 07076]